MSDLTIQIGDLNLRNPIMPASGTFSEELADVFDLGILGAHVTKTITQQIRGGNPTPRVCEVQGGMLNSIGIPSKGVAYFKNNVIPFYGRFDTPLIVSISANTTEGFVELCKDVSVEGVAAIEVNISCPNIEDNGKAFAMRPSSTHEVLKQLRASTSLPLWAKLTPNTGETIEVAEAASEAGADALVVSNTMLSMAVDVHSRKPKLGNLMGGLSGPALKPIALRMAYQCARAVSIPVIGCGGISNLDDVLEFLIAGASAVQVGTATFLNPTIMPSIISGLQAYLRDHQIDCVSELVGSILDTDLSENLSIMEVAP